jgi:hypothetical protein
VFVNNKVAFFHAFSFRVTKNGCFLTRADLCNGFESIRANTVLAFAIAGAAFMSKLGRLLISRADSSAASVRRRSLVYLSIYVQVTKTRFHVMLDSLLFRPFCQTITIRPRKASIGGNSKQLKGSRLRSEFAISARCLCRRHNGKIM